MSAEYRAWLAMRNRCHNKQGQDYDSYGGRGIKVCERWEKFENFIADMGRRPSGRHSIDRIDVNRNYEPGNCRWATRSEQTSNRRNCIYIETGDETVTLKEYCRRKELRYGSITKRIREGWPINLAISVPIGPPGVHPARKCGGCAA